MELDKQRDKVMQKMDGQRYDDGRQYDDRPQQRYDDRRQYDDRPPKHEQPRQPLDEQEWAKRKDELGRIAEGALRGMPSNLKPSEVLYVITMMIKMVCILLDES
jgi:hypothetical protein